MGKLMKHSAEKIHSSVWDTGRLQVFAFSGVGEERATYK